MNCTTCGKRLVVENIKYHTAPKNGTVEHVFCDAYCSFEFYNKKDDRTSET